MYNGEALGYTNQRLHTLRYCFVPKVVIKKRIEVRIVPISLVVP